MKIGIMGGTFNPIHLGHLLIAENAYDEYGLDEVIFMPAGIPPHKREGVLDKEHRCSMILEAIKDIPYFSLDRREVDSEDVSYTYITLSKLKEEHPENTYYFIMGADSLDFFINWMRTDIILEKAIILAAVRDNMDMDKMNKDKISILLKYPYGKIEFLSTPEFNVSSNDIRKRVLNKQSIKYLVCDSVREYIYDNALYED